MEKGSQHTIETIAKMKLNHVGMSGRKHSVATLKKMTKTHTGKAPTFGHQGRKHSPETIEKLRHINDGFKYPVGEKSFIKMAHRRIMAEVEILEKEGFKCIPITSVIPDIIAIKDGKIYAVEVEYWYPNYRKYDKENYSNRFDGVKWILKGKAAKSKLYDRTR